MTLAYRDGATGFENNSVSSVSLTIPSTIQAGDLMILSRAGQSGAGTISGWTQIVSSASAGAGITDVYVKTATSGDAGATLTINNGITEREGILLVAYYSTTGLAVNVDQVSTPHTDTGSATPSTGTLTTSVANQLVVSLWQGRENNNFSATTVTAGSGYTARKTQSSGQQTYNHAGDEVKATVGVTTARSCSLNQTQDSRSVQVSLLESATVAGAVAAVALAAPAGTPSVSGNVTGSLATVAVAAPTGAALVGAANVTGSLATVAVAAPLGTVTIRTNFSGYGSDANHSQALRIRVEMTATLLADVTPASLPSHYTDPQVRARRLSLIMPTPTLDSRGRPT